MVRSAHILWPMVGFSPPCQRLSLSLSLIRNNPPPTDLYSAGSSPTQMDFCVRKKTSVMKEGAPSSSRLSSGAASRGCMELEGAASRGCMELEGADEDPRSPAQGKEGGGRSRGEGLEGCQGYERSTADALKGWRVIHVTVHWS